MNVSTAELTGTALDWAVAIAEGFTPEQLYISKGVYCESSIYTTTFDADGVARGYMTGPDRLYSRKWEAGGQIIEREQIAILPCPNGWSARIGFGGEYIEGTTPLIAAMRCYVASKLGDNVELPEGLA
jgi:hypothetical protein